MKLVEIPSRLSKSRFGLGIILNEKSSRRCREVEKDRNDENGLGRKIGEN